MRIGLYFLSFLCLLPAALASCEDSYSNLRPIINGLRSSIDNVMDALKKVCANHLKNTVTSTLEDDLKLLGFTLQCNGWYQPNGLNSWKVCRAVVSAYDQTFFANQFTQAAAIAHDMCQNQCSTIDLTPLQNTLSEDLNYVQSLQ
ncbi:hypothetical protein L596_013938 [Steinernema carpocapsae]|uniref:Secreted protein n=1 Tax=Steinernema carpocapsae TaxID=34508 RepID=A0A4U5P1M3_STECR|nr:hypothetical protein L596_013938 [Steinernema carpocapsae]